METRVILRNAETGLLLSILLKNVQSLYDKLDPSLNQFKSDQTITLVRTKAGSICLMIDDERCSYMEIITSGCCSSLEHFMIGCCRHQSSPEWAAWSYWWTETSQLEADFMLTMPTCRKSCWNITNCPTRGGTILHNVYTPSLIPYFRQITRSPTSVSPCL